MPLLGDPRHAELVKHLKQLPALIAKPSAILVISAHWEEDIPTLTAGASPPLFYDYYNFPAESYQISYPAPGAPELTTRISGLLQQQGIANRMQDRGFDHGVFVPLKIMYPDAEIPCIQLSLMHNLDAAAHIQLGEALRELNHEGLLVLGSGFSFHNIPAFRAPATAQSQQMNEDFERWLIDTMCNSDISEAQRKERLIHWSEAPFARFAQPREEHLLPLHVCYGLAARASSKTFSVQVMGKQASSYLWSN